MFLEFLDPSWLALAVAGPFRRNPACDDRKAERDDFLVVSSAIHAVLSACSAACAKRQFAACRNVYRTLRLQLRLRQPIRLCPYLLNEALHEIAHHVERPVREAALRCVMRMRAAA